MTPHQGLPPAGSPPDAPPPRSQTLRVALPRWKVAALVLGLAALLGATVGVTLLLGGEKHSGGEHAHDEHGEDEKGEDEKGHGHGEKGHGDEHGAKGRVKLSPAALEKSGIETRAAGPGKVAVTLSLPGELSVNADALAHVSPRVGGAVREVKKTLGDTVKKGDVLATVDSRELAEIQQELSAAKARLELAKASFQRQEKLYGEKIAAEKDYLAAKQALAEAEIDYRSASQKLRAAGAGGGGGTYQLVAPLDGTIIEKHVNVGEVVKDDTPAFVIADLSKLWVNVTVYAKDLSKVRTGQRVTVRAEGIDGAVEGTIDYVGHVVGEATRSATARVVLPNPGPAWRPGLIVTALVAVEEVDAAVVVADEAIQTVEGKSVVFVKEGDAFEARPVTLGRTGNGDPAARVVEITGGLAAGDVYVAKNSFLLKAELGKSEAGHEH